MKRVYSEIAGIYKLTCEVNNKIYIGKANNLSKRLSKHKNTEKENNPRYYLQNAIIKYGWCSFSVEILETFKDFNPHDAAYKKLILDRESYYIELFDSTNKDKGYNICKHSTDNTGRKHSEESKEKMRQAHLGKVFSEEHRKKISLHRKGSKASPEAKINMSLSKKGKPISKEVREKRIGKPRSEETKEKLRQFNTGKKMSEEAKEKIRIAATGRIHSKETIEKILLKRKWYKPTEETREKMRQAQQRIKLERLSK
jgi:group I intron endonuclease